MAVPGAGVAAFVACRAAPSGTGATRARSPDPVRHFTRGQEPGVRRAWLFHGAACAPSLDAE